MKKMGLKEFEFSQNYAMFWDKIERANYFLEAIIETADRDIDDRTVAYLLESVADDGGQWNMFVAIVAKHGLVPKAVMPETQSSSNTGRMNSVLRNLLRQGAKSVREAAARGADAARAEKAEVLRVIYRVLCIHLGTPPERFDWQWTDKDREFHRDGVLTPQEFAAKYVDLPIDDYVCLVHDPRASSPAGRTFTVEYLGNVLGAPPVTYLNVDMSVIKDIAARTLQGGEPVWFGCDVGKMMSNDYGVWDANLYDLPSVYDADFTLDKADRLVYHETQMTHAMLFTGVDVLDGVTAPVAGREQLGRGPGQGRLLHDERLVVRRVRLRDRGPAQRAARGAAAGARRRADRAAGLGPDGRPGPLGSGRPGRHPARLRPVRRACGGDPPVAEPGQGHGQREEDRGLVPLERPVAAGGLVGHHLPQVQPGERGLAGLDDAVLLAQAGVAGPVKAWPAALMVWSDSTQAPGIFTAPVTVIWPPFVTLISVRFAVLNGEITRTGVIRCGLIPSGMASWTAAKAASVMAMAGTVRRMSTPGGDAEGEGERGVADRDDVRARRTAADHRRSNACSVRLDRGVDRAGPPGHHQAEQPGRGHAGQADQAELDRQPSGAGDALGPGQPEGAGLELAGDQRRAPEQRR